MAHILRPSMHWLFGFLPVALLLERAHAPPPWVFFSAAIAIVPAAALIVRFTEALAAKTGDAIGGLLNATFGNAPELIICIAALRAGYVEMVRASLIGAVLANLLLALGASFFLGGLKKHTQEYNPLAARTAASMMMLAAISLAVPSGFRRYFAPEVEVPHEGALNLGVCAALLASYAMYLLYTLRTHKREFASLETDAPRAPMAHARTHHEHAMSAPRAVAGLLIASALAAWMSETLVGAAEGTGRALGMSEVFIGVVLLAVVGGAAESGSAIAMARKDRMDLSVGIAMGSSIQIALFVAPTLALLSAFIGPRPLMLSFTRAEVGSLLLGVLIGVIICGDGKANWFKGAQLIAVYAIIALMFYFMPEAAA